MKVSTYRQLYKKFQTDLILDLRGRRRRREEEERGKKRKI
jgi:hypothetical protein